MEKTIEEKYGIVYVEGERYYSFSLNEKKYDLESTRPFFVRIDGKVLEEHTWNNLIVLVFDYVITRKNISREELLSFSTEWSKSLIISSSKLSRTYMDLKNGLFVNTNHTAVHCCWIIQDFLNFCSYELNDVSIIIKRTGVSEPKEVRDYFINKSIAGFNQYIVDVFPETKRKILVTYSKYLKAVDEKFTMKAFKSVYSIYLVDNVQTMYKLKEDYINYLKFKTTVRKEQLEYIIEGLNLYYQYIKYLHN